MVMGCWSNQNSYSLRINCLLNTNIEQQRNCMVGWSYQMRNYLAQNGEGVVEIILRL